jgi:hypothetical protein
VFPPSPLGTSQRSKSCIIGGAPEQSDPASNLKGVLGMLLLLLLMLLLMLLLLKAKN